jgi:hypothetical protein
VSRSEAIGALAEALAKAQGEYDAFKKGNVAKGERFNYSYASLDDLLIAVQPALTKHGLSHTILMDELEGKGVKLECVLMHTSGQFISSEMYLRLDPSKRMSPMQQLGSAITYGRRYLLQSLIGVASEEDTDDAPRQQEEPKESGRTKPPVKFPRSGQQKTVTQNGPILSPSKNETKKPLTEQEIVAKIENAMNIMTNNYEDMETVAKLENEIGVQSKAELLKLPLEKKREVLNKLYLIYKERQVKSDGEKEVS